MQWFKERIKSVRRKSKEEKKKKEERKKNSDSRKIDGLLNTLNPFNFDDVENRSKEFK